MSTCEETNQPALGERLKQLRLAHGWSLEELAAGLGGVVTRQALWKYEHGRARPSLLVLNRLAALLGVKAVHLWQDPPIDVRFIAYRKGSGLLKGEQQRVEAAIRLALEQRWALQERIRAAGGWREGDGELPIQALEVHSIEDAEQAAEELRRRWDLGREPLCSVTAVLEGRAVHVLEVEAPDKFDGISATAWDPEGRTVAAAVVTRRGLPGERQRLNLAHELGHLALAVRADIDEEKAAFRFGTAFLAPAESVRQLVGARRGMVQLSELLLLKRHFGMSVQALIRRLRDLEIITEPQYVAWCVRVGRLGFRKAEPEPLPPERSEWLLRSVLYGLSEGLVTRDEAEALVPGIDAGEQSLTLKERRALMRLPVQERRRLLEAQAEKLATAYEDDCEREAFQGGDIVEY